MSATVEMLVHLPEVDLASPQRELVEDGWWVTCALGPATGSGTWQIRHRSSAGPITVISQIRVALRTAAAAGAADDVDREVWDWVEGGYRSTLAVLRRRCPCRVGFTVAGRRIDWDLHPVRFLAQVPPELPGTADALPLKLRSLVRRGGQASGADPSPASAFTRIHDPDVEPDSG